MGRRTSPGGALAASKRVDARQRDKETGRYVHEWGLIGQGDTGETAECQHCGKVRFYGDTEKTYKDREAARKAGVPLFEGY